MAWLLKPEASVVWEAAARAAFSRRCRAALQPSCTEQLLPLAGCRSRPEINRRLLTLVHACLQVGGRFGSLPLWLLLSCCCCSLRCLLAAAAGAVVTAAAAAAVVTAAAAGAVVTAAAAVHKRVLAWTAPFCCVVHAALAMGLLEVSLHCCIKLLNRPLSDLLLQAALAMGLLELRPWSPRTVGAIGTLTSLMNCYM